MDSTAPISVLVGKAVLTENGLYVNDRKTDLQDSSQFSAMVMTTQAIIAEALSVTFADDHGQLVKDSGGHYFIAPGLAPWDQYVQSTLRLTSSPDSREIVVGWCVLLHLVSRFSKSLVIEPKAAMIAKFIATQAAWSMDVDRTELDAWLTWGSMRNPFGSDLEQIRHEALRPTDPYRKRHSVSVPWIDLLGQFSAFDSIHDFFGDILISIPQQTASLHVVGDVLVHGHFSTLDVIPANPPETDFVLNVDHRGEVMRFRAQVDETKAALRLLQNSAYSVEQGALQ